MCRRSLQADRVDKEPAAPTTGEHFIPRRGFPPLDHLSRLASEDQVINHEYDDRTDNCHQEAI